MSIIPHIKYRTLRGSFYVGESVRSSRKLRGRRTRPKIRRLQSHWFWSMITDILDVVSEFSSTVTRASSLLVKPGSATKSFPS